MLASAVAAVLGCSVWTVHNMAADGRLTPVTKLPGQRGAYLFRRSDVEQLAQRMTAETAAAGGDAA